MKTINLGKLIASAIAILGGIHIVATFTPIINGILTNLPEADYRFMLFANLICGAFFIICGILLVMLLRKIETYTFLINPVFFIGSMLLLSGIVLVSLAKNIFDNPFACICVLLDVAIFWVAVNLFVKFKFPSKPKKWYNCL